MEVAFDQDFSDVRMHEGEQAAGIGAFAYTQGNDIHFSSARFNPKTREGRKLIGHELTHVVQQHAGRVRMPREEGAPINADPKLEREADEVGARLASTQATGLTDGRGQTGPANRTLGPSGTGAGPKPATQLRATASNVIQRMKASETDPREFERHMNELHARQQRGEELSEQDRNQLIAYRSNANYLSNRVKKAIKRSQYKRRRNPHGWTAQRINRDLEHIRSLTSPENQGSLFTRDIDAGELTGLTYSRRLMSVNERQLDRIGRIRNMKDLNRGGGAGSYTRVISAKRVEAQRRARRNLRNYDPSKDPDLAPLGIGSIGNSGITLALDAAGVAGDVRNPLELFHNNQDSAGRIFGRKLPSGRRVGRGSERILGRMNPAYYRRTNQSPPQTFQC